MLEREFPILKLFCFLSRTTCTAEGKWSHPLPSCLAPCILPEVEQGVLGDLRVGQSALYIYMYPNLMINR